MSLSILALETSSESCSVAIQHGGKRFQSVSVEPRGHASHVLPFVDQLLKQADITLKDLDVIAFTRGPGAFTGVRIGTSVGQGLALAADLPLIAVSSLAVLAQSSYRHTGHSQCIAALDARMSEVYVGFYQLNADKCMTALRDDQVASPEVIDKSGISGAKPWQAYGAGWTNYLDQMKQHFSGWTIDYPDKLVFPEALDLLSLAEVDFQNGHLLDAAEAIPVYVRDQVVRA